MPISSRLTKVRSALADLPELVITLDFGGSLTKCLYLHQGKLLPLCMEPEVINVPFDSITRFESSRLSVPGTAVLPEDAAWVAYAQPEQYYAVGYLAQSQFHGNPGLTQLKYERATPKILAAVWAASQKMGLSQKFSAAVGILLPPGEYENGKRLQNLVSLALSRFVTPSGLMEVDLKFFDCKPEGGGVYLLHSASSKGALARKTLAVVMVGFRNASVLVSHRGNLTKRVTSNLGFTRFIEMVLAQTSGLDSNALAKRVSMYNNEPSNSAVLIPLLMSSTESNKRNELEGLIKAIDSSRAEYAAALKSWLSDNLPRDTEDVIFCGGTVDFLKLELTNHFKGLNLLWHGINLPQYLRDGDLGMRMADVYGMHRYFLSVIAQQVSRDVTVSNEVK